MKISDWISAVSALITLLLAIAAFWQLWLSRKSIEAAKQSAEATEISAKAMQVSVERMKDAQRPYFDVGVGWHNCVTVTIRNIGPGLGKIRLVTVRTDIKNESVSKPVNYWPYIHPPFEGQKGQTMINNFVIGSEEEFTFQFMPDSTFSSIFVDDLNLNSLSSISVFYEDVYGKVYRARTVYSVESSAPNCLNGVIVLLKENFEDKLPIKPQGMFDVRWINEIEGQSPVVYRGQYLLFHRLKSIKSLEGTKLEGTEFTQNADITFLGVTFPWHGFPQLHLQIENNLPLRLSYIQDREGQHAKIYDIDSDNRSRNSEYGLFSDGEDKDLMIMMYHQLTNNLITLLENSQCLYACEERLNGA